MKAFRLSPSNLPLPRGTEVVLKVDLTGEDGMRFKKGTSARVEVGHHDTYDLRTPGGRRLTAQRDQLAIQKQQVAEQLLAQAEAFTDLEQHVIYRAVVGSTAWGLADGDSDEDCRGIFLLPFERQTSLFRQPDEIRDPASDTSSWEVEKLLHLLLRADAHAIELLWTPLVKFSTPLAEQILAHKQAFLTNSVIGSFGRYALSQMKKIENRLEQEHRGDHVTELIRQGLAERGQILQALADARWPGEVDDARIQQAGQTLDALANSLFDRGLSPSRNFEGLRTFLQEHPDAPLFSEGPYRPKNAYNLIRLLHSGILLLESGEPMIEVTGALRDWLLDIKRGKVAIELVTEEALRLGQQFETATENSVLPDEPPYALADSLLREARREAATRHFSVLKPTAMDLRLAQPESLPFELPDEAWAFLEQQLAGGMIQLGLVGAHAYGFPSPDSDFDFKGIHLAPTDAVLGLGPVEENRDTTSWLGGVEVDFTTHEAAKALHMLLKGNGNVLERLVSPFQLVRGEIPDRLRELGQASIGTHFLKHYRGYLQGKRRELASQGENPSIKTLLYVYRVGLTGLHLLRTGECLLDVEPLSVLYGFPEVPDLIALKTVERATAQAPFDPEPLDRLDVELEAALQQSPLATAAPNAREFDALLNALRRARQAQNSSDA